MVGLIKQSTSISVENILTKAKELSEECEDKVEFETWRGENTFPPLPCDPRDQESWTYDVRRAYLRVMFNRLGFYKGSFKSLKEGSHVPDGFPRDKLSWKIFGQKGGPNGVRKEDANLIIQSFFDHYMPGTRMTNYFQGYDDQQEDISDQGTSPISDVSAGPSSGATLVTPGPSSRAGPSPRELRFSTPSIPSSSGTPTVIFNKKRKFHQAETDEEEIDSSLEESEHNITYNDEDTEVEDEDEVACVILYPE